ncbi:sugar transferase [Pseudoruegeria sp. HB172150]|uniref:sugar transferase n=1 Tax=Pseudoruegeria sp. HB172150 TaxID=2721164 RepID=UPI0020A66F36|nr:sugar transferase [Pseudoruegeria sp. HB172150]
MHDLIRTEDGFINLPYELIPNLRIGSSAKMPPMVLDVSDIGAITVSNHTRRDRERDVGPPWRVVFSVSKRAFDIGMCLLLVPIFLIVAVFLLALNPWLNAGPLFFVQKRMGRDCAPFAMFKFRSMCDAGSFERTPECPLELHRITVLGRFIRGTRVDELPQIINVLKGEMSLIGPRPDFYEHALHYLCEVSGYCRRHRVRPGISGLAQTEVGYVTGSEATRRKVSADLYYISHTDFKMEAWLVWRTLTVIFSRMGI